MPSGLCRLPVAPVEGSEEQRVAVKHTGYPSTSIPGGSDGKESVYNAGNPGSILRWERSPGGGHGNPLQYSCLENPMHRRAWCSPHGCKESDMTEATEHSTAQHPPTSPSLPSEKDAGSQRTEDKGKSPTARQAPALQEFASFDLLKYEDL